MIEAATFTAAAVVGAAECVQPGFDQAVSGLVAMLVW